MVGGELTDEVVASKEGLRREKGEAGGVLLMMDKVDGRLEVMRLGVAISQNGSRWVMTSCSVTPRL